MSIIIGYHSDPGAKHTVNQDSLCIKTVTAGSQKAIVAGVFDGMGGLKEGEKASGAAARAFSEWVDTNREMIGSGNTAAICGSLESALDKLNEKVRSYGRKVDAEVGTTVVVLIIVAEDFLVCNVGDSRAYLLDSRRTVQVSEDHTLVNDLIKAGLLAKEQAQDFPQKNVLTQAVGVMEKVAPSFNTGKIREGHVFLLCSDGLYRNLTEDDFRQIYSAASGKEEISKALCELTAKVISKGETDNITGIVIKD